jgi:addiction module RelB/DinJ family antitoxin
MAKTASMYIRIDPEVKADVEKIYSRFGMSLTDAINIFLYQSRNIGGLPFELRSNDDKKANDIKSLRGALHKYANPALIPGEDPDLMGTLHQYANPSLITGEEGAWERAVVEKERAWKEAELKKENLRKKS